ncbi:MAG: O-succinylhomoserine sulfhydrylase [Gammaproteobacteria bacterium]|nr:MAG: O-succinylhomoserine sulfhydrylase [Gammaproteobacteria bacterium]
MSDNENLGLETLAVRAGQRRTQEGEHSEPIFTTSSYVFANAAEAAARFSGKEPGNVYSRFTNPTVRTFEQRLAALEGGERCVATASGMAAILAVAMSLLKAGDHILTSSNLFGSTVLLFKNILGRFGVETTFVQNSDIADWEQAIQSNTRLLFIETPANPLTDVFDIRQLAELAHRKDCLLVVDNCFCTPILQRPLALGADIVVHSATKFLDGQGRCIGGAVVGNEALVGKEVYTFLRSAGPCMSPFNAWVFLKGLETLSLRIKAQSEQALQLAQWLEQQGKVERVYYPGLSSHPQHALAMQQQSAGGAIVSFEVAGGQEQAWTVIDNTKLLSITANLGDTRTTITHPATTTHGRLSAEERARAGIQDNLIRLAVGLETLDDIKNDLQCGLDACH